MHATRKLWTCLAVICVLSFSVLGWVGTEIYLTAPPIPKQVVSTEGYILTNQSSGATVDIRLECTPLFSGLAHDSIGISLSSFTLSDPLMRDTVATVSSILSSVAIDLAVRGEFDADYIGRHIVDPNGLNQAVSLIATAGRRAVSRSTSRSPRRSRLCYVHRTTRSRRICLSATRRTSTGKKMSRPRTAGIGYSQSV